MEPNDQNAEGLAPDPRGLEELEGVIRRGLETFVEVGNAIREIRERKLYKGEHATFEEYCRERWGWGRVHAHRHIEAAKTAEILLPTGNAPPNERQARELAPLAKEDPETARRVWGGLTAEHGDDLTAKHVKKAVEEVKEAKVRRETLPPEVRTVIEGSDPEDTSLSRNPAQLKNLGDIAAKRGPEKAAETAERVANGEFKSTFDAYPEVKAERQPLAGEDRRPVGETLAGEDFDLPPWDLPPERKEYGNVVKNLVRLAKLDPEQIASYCKGEYEAGRDLEHVRALQDWFGKYESALEKKRREHRPGNLRAVE